MPETPPIIFPLWADDVAAEVTDPGAGKRGTGWNLAEPPAHDHMNFMLNLQGDWIQYMVNVYAPYLAFSNIEYGVDTFPTGITRYRIHYDELAGRWYSATEVTNVGYWHDAPPDAGVWTESGILMASLDPGTELPAPVSNGSIVAAAQDNIWYKSTDNSVSNLSAQGSIWSGGPPNLISTKGLTYSDVTGYWCHTGGGDGALGYISYATTPLSSWTTVGIADQPRGHAMDPATGRVIVITDGASNEVWRTENGFTFAEIATPGAGGGGFFSVWWSSSMERFFALDGNSDLHFSFTGDTWHNFTLNDMNAASFLGGAFLSDQFAALNFAPGDWLSVRNAAPQAGIRGANLAPMGTLTGGYQPGPGSTDAGSRYILPYLTAGGNLNIMRFGPSNG